MSERVYNMLFLRVGNSARSILAESILRKVGGACFRPFSAGRRRKGVVHPLALKVLARYDYPVDGVRSKNWDEFAGAGARAWISASRFATTPPAKSARSGPDCR
jgi:arsenate reductase